MPRFFSKGTCTQRKVSSLHGWRSAGLRNAVWRSAGWRRSVRAAAGQCGRAGAKRRADGVKDSTSEASVFEAAGVLSCSTKAALSQTIVCQPCRCAHMVHTSSVTSLVTDGIMQFRHEFLARSSEVKVTEPKANMNRAYLCEE